MTFVYVQFWSPDPVIPICIMYLNSKTQRQQCLQLALQQWVPSADRLCSPMWGHQAYWPVGLLWSNTQLNHEFWAARTFDLRLLCSPGHFSSLKGASCTEVHCWAFFFCVLISSFLCSSMYLWLSGAVCISVCPLLAAVPCLTSCWEWRKR